MQPRIRHIIVIVTALLSLCWCARLVWAEDALPAHDHARMAMDAEPPAASSDSSFFGNLLQTYTPRQVCMNHEQVVIWLHIISDAIIALAYFTIPLALVRFVGKRKDLAFNWMFVCFAVFILACGLTHVLGVIAIWSPVYRLDGIVKAITAIASIVTAILLWRLIPAAIILPSPTQLREANQQLEREVIDRRAAEEKLRVAHNELEARVRDRTAELTNANASERLARAEAERASRMKDEFLASLSHELRTPLNAILGWASILRRDQPDAADLAQGLDTIDRNARAQAKIIEDLLDMSSIISGKVRLDIQSVAIETVLRSAIATMTPAADAKGIHIDAMIDSNVGSISADAARLQQVFWNLLSNAIKFTPRGGKVSVRLQHMGSHVKVGVIDTGEGIRADFLPHVFDRFRQADASITRRHGGLGLGLAIVKQLIELHGGTVSVKSDGEGHGSMFTVSLPSVARHPAIQDDPRPREAGSGIETADDPSDFSEEKCGSIKGVKVLVVDDEPDALALVKRLLEKCMAIVATAGTTAEAFLALQAERPDVLVSDIGMPGEDGYAFIKRVRALGADRGGNVPAVALTAYARSEDRMKAIVSGFQMHVPKPVEAAELITMIATLVGQKNA